MTRRNSGKVRKAFKLIREASRLLSEVAADNSGEILNPAESDCAHLAGEIDRAADDCAHVLDGVQS